MRTVVVQGNFMPSADIGKALNVTYIQSYDEWVRIYMQNDEEKGMCKVLCGLGVSFYVTDDNGNTVYNIEAFEDEMLNDITREATRDALVRAVDLAIDEATQADYLTGYGVM